MQMELKYHLITDTKSNEDYISLTDIAKYRKSQMIHLVLLRIGCETETQ